MNIGSASIFGEIIKRDIVYTINIISATDSSSLPNPFSQCIYLIACHQVDELRGKLEEKNKLIEKKTQAALHATQDKNRISNELSDLRDQVDIKDRKINVLQRKVKVLI